MRIFTPGIWSGRTYALYEEVVHTAVWIDSDVKGVDRGEHRVRVQSASLPHPYIMYAPSEFQNERIEHSTSSALVPYC